MKLWSQAIEEADRQGLMGQDRQNLYNRYWSNPPEDVVTKAVNQGKKAGFDRVLSSWEEKWARSVTVRLLGEAFGRWPFQFTRWATEMLGGNPEVLNAMRHGRLFPKGWTAEDVAGYLVKSAAGWGGLMLLNEFYNHIDFNSMQYIHANGERTRISNLEPLSTGFFLLALMKGKVDDAYGSLRYASIPLARLLAGEGGLLGSIVSLSRDAIKKSDVDPKGLKRELTDLVNQFISGQGLLKAFKTLFDPTLREGIGANIPIISTELRAKINPATGEPLRPRQKLPLIGVEVPAIGGTPVPGARQIYDPTTRWLSKYGVMVYRGPRQPIVGYPAGELPEEVTRDWQIAFGQNLTDLVDNMTPTLERLERDNPDDLHPGDSTYEQIKKILQRQQGIAAKRAKGEVSQELEARPKPKRQPGVWEKRGPKERVPFEATQ